MKDSKGKRRRKRPDRNAPDDSLDALLPSYTPKQREKVVKGLRVLARVAIRSFLEHRGVPPDGCRHEQDDARVPGCKPEPRRGDSHECE